ncbi:MAG: DUF1440 domain-containing protein [Aureispira sp.]
MTNKISIFDFTKSSSPIKNILWAGLIAGTLDAIAGVIVYYIYFGFNPFQVLQFIASGVYGPEAIDSGIPMMLAGTFFHYLIAFVVAVIYFIAFPKIKLLRTNVVVMGLIFGAAIWGVMNLLILPSSNIPKAPFDAGLAVIGIIWHMVLVGLPIALITANYFSEEKD